MLPLLLAMDATKKGLLAFVPQMGTRRARRFACTRRGLRFNQESARIGPRPRSRSGLHSSPHTPSRLRTFSQHRRHARRHSSLGSRRRDCSFWRRSDERCMTARYRTGCHSYSQGHMCSRKCPERRPPLRRRPGNRGPSSNRVTMECRTRRNRLQTTATRPGSRRGIPVGRSRRSCDKKRRRRPSPTSLRCCPSPKSLRRRPNSTRFRRRRARSRVQSLQEGARACVLAQQAVCRFWRLRFTGIGGPKGDAILSQFPRRVHQLLSVLAR